MVGHVKALIRVLWQFYWNGDASSVGSEETGRGKGEREFVERKKVLESPLSDLETVHSER